MNAFEVKGGQFWLDGRPQLIQAGEFHYFRTPVDEWAHRLGLLSEAGFNAVAAYIPWLWHQPEAGISDLDGHSHPMRDLAGFLDLAAGMGFWIIPRPGPYIMAETINEGIPPWVFERHPQAAFVSQSGAIQNIASYLHPDFLKCVRDWYRAVFEILSPRQVTWDGKIIMVQLDNEMGMPHWLRNILDTNPDTLARFAGWLQNRYGEALAGRYPAGELVDFLREGITNPSEPYGVSIVEDYRHFYRGYLREYMGFLWDEARANGMEVPPVVNVHGFLNGGKTFPIGLSQLIEVMEMDGMISATDVYPLAIGEGNFPQLLMVNEITKALQNPHQPLFSIEFQSGGNQDFGTGQTSFYDLHTRLCISTGMRAINHYSFFAGENDPVLSPVRRHDWGPPVRVDGSLRKHYHRYPKLSAALAAYGEDLVRSQPETVAAVGFMLEYFMTEVNSPLTQAATKTMTHQREVVLFDFLGRGLALTHRPFHAVDLDRAALDPTENPIVFAMMDKQCDATTQAKLVEYVRRGGRLVLGGRMCIESFDHTHCTVLKDASGIRGTRDYEFDPGLIRHNIRVFDRPYIPVSLLETYTGDFDEVFATHPDGGVVGFIQSIGEGRLMHFGASLTVDAPEDLGVFDRIAREADCPRAFELSTWADVRFSRGENGGFLFINNYQDDPLETTIAHRGERLFGGNPIRLPARRGAILPFEWTVRPGLLLHYITSEIVAVEEDEDSVTIKTDQPDVDAELSLSGYRIEGAAAGEGERIRFKVRDGLIVFHMTS
ncbi:MAG TPA: beta-galactosidase [Anaerolineales bacterium]|nr:beta-galactosidase [Anaerolineales bacterium]